MAKNQASSPRELASALLTQSLAQGCTRWEVTALAKMAHSLPLGSPLIQQRYADEDVDTVSRTGMGTLWGRPSSHSRSLAGVWD